LRLPEMSRQPQPRYMELAHDLRNQLDTYKPGDYLPSELTLAQHYGVNRHTLRRAVDELVAEGRVLRQKGRGTCVLPHPIVYPLHSASAYSKTLQGMGFQSSAVLLGKRERAPKDDETAELQLQSGEPVVELETLRFLDDQPISLITHCFAAHHRKLVQGYAGGSMREHLALQGVPLKRLSTWIGARTPTQHHARVLMMPRHTPLLTIRTLSCGPDGKPFELSRTLTRADRFKYHVISGEQRDQ
jgi:GntR family phosphonate transport system transcriptional regulator